MKPGKLAPMGAGFGSATVYPHDYSAPVMGTLVVDHDGNVRFEPYPPAKKPDDGSLDKFHESLEKLPPVTSDDDPDAENAA